MNLSISYSGEASGSFATRIASMAGYYVRLTTQDDETIEAEIVGSGDDWYDAVTYKEVDPESGLADDDAPVRTVRVRDVHVY